MPYKNVLVKNRKILTRKGITIYQACDGDDFNDPLTFWFTQDPYHDDDSFDVRTLSTAGSMDFEGIKKAIRAAIDKGEIRKQKHK